MRKGSFGDHYHRVLVTAMRLVTGARSFIFDSLCEQELRPMKTHFFGCLQERSIQIRKRYCILFSW
jgi:hypothetical protein